MTHRSITEGTINQAHFYSLVKNLRLKADKELVLKKLKINAYFAVGFLVEIRYKLEIEKKFSTKNAAGKKNYPEILLLKFS